MNIKNALVGLVFLAVVGGTAYFTNRHFVQTSQQCSICGRAVHADHESTVELKDGTSIHACCPRCALHYELHESGRITRLLVDDRATGQRLDARKAWYVEGSDDRSCVPASEMPPREPGVGYDRTYDRCLPSLVAFKDESAARQFVMAHSGRILTYEQAMESVRQH